MDDKELTDLEICKAISKMKGYEEILKGDPLHQQGKFSVVKSRWKQSGNVKHYGSFNPITDNAINLELRDEYEVTVDYRNSRVYKVTLSGVCVDIIYFTDKSQINRAVLECILESVK